MSRDVLKFSAVVLSFLLSILFVTNAALADNSTELVGIRALGYAMDHVNCRITFVTKYVNNLALVAPNAFLVSSSYLKSLQIDQQQLQNYANMGDISNFRVHIQNNFDPDFKQFKDSLNNQIKQANLSPAALDSVRKNFASYSSEYEKCALTALDNYAAEKINAYNFILNKYQLEMFSLSSKGIDIYPLVVLLQKENTQIIIPLTNISNTFVPNLNATTSLRVALNNYCLFDGCINGKNGHLAGNFEATKLQVILNYMKHNPKYSSASNILSHAQDSLNVAETTLVSLGTSPYISQEQIDLVWGNIYSASKDMRQVVSIYGG